jgi:hypothetical protein
MRWLRLVPVALLGILGIGYVFARPALTQAVPNAAILEFPIGAIVVAFLLWAALARGRPDDAPKPWRRHEQVVRALPDPAIRPDALALTRWAETGEDAAGAADVLARARTSDRQERQRLRARLTEDLAIKASRRARESKLRKHLEGV